MPFPFETATFLPLLGVPATLRSCMVQAEAVKSRRLVAALAALHNAAAAVQNAPTPQGRDILLAELEEHLSAAEAGAWRKLVDDEAPSSAALLMKARRTRLHVAIIPYLHDRHP